MKKLLVILLCFPLLFTTCKKEEEEISNTGNTSTGNNGNTTLTWEKTFFDGVSDQKGGAFCINQTADDGYVFLCHAVSDIDFFMKIDKNGNEEWSQEQYDYSREFDYLAKTSDGGIIIVGNIGDTSSNSAPNAVHLLKVNEYGNQQWNTEIQQSGGGVGYVAETNDGGYIILAGNLIKTNSQGVLEWKKDTDADAVFHTNDGGYIISDSDSLIKINSNGNVEWEKHAFIKHTPFTEYNFNSIEQTTDGGYILGGSVGEKPNYELLLAKVDANGNVEWEKTYGGDSDGEFAQQTSDGGYIIIGTTSSLGNGSSDVYFVKTDANGNQVIGKTFGGTDSDDGESISATSDGGYIIGGATESFGDNNIYILKVDENGNL